MRLPLLSILWCAVVCAVASPVFATTFTISPYLQNGTQTEMTVKWETDLPTSSIVEWGRDLSFGQIVSSPTTGTRHRVRLTGLTPETYYYYRVQSRDAVSSPARFMTAPLRRTPFRCVVYGDNREPATMHKAIITEMVKDMPTMVVHVGEGIWRSVP
jgi:phosphodiesterase/alkaline phosphatase D-like protein